ncbi:MAG: methyltransferase [Bacteroidaceae bacterium]|jgi:tRNA1Val (adenine37-N6)-methyltransferase
MSSQVFHFKQFSVCHAGSAMKVGTDGVLLGLLSECSGHHLLDIGTGSGLVALLLAQRNAEALITGVEIDPDAAVQAEFNFLQSSWRKRLKSVCTDVSDFDPGYIFDVIVCNPPYYEHSPQNSTLARDYARNVKTLSREVLISTIVRLLAPNGFFSVILPYEGADDFILLCWQSNLYLCHRTLIYTKVGKVCKRVVLVFSKNRAICQERIITLHGSDGLLSREYQELVKDFFI